MRPDPWSRPPPRVVMPELRTALFFAGVCGLVVAGGAIFYSQILDCPGIVLQRGRELQAARAARSAAPSCAEDLNLLTALANLQHARSTCAVRRYTPRESSAAPSQGELDEMVSRLRGKLAAACDGAP